MSTSDIGEGPEVSDSWFPQGKCYVLFNTGKVDPEVFFPEKGESTLPAKRICKGEDGMPRCRVYEICQLHGVHNERYGVWGGLSERERVHLRKELRRRAQAQREAREQAARQRRQVVRRPNPMMDDET